MPQSYAWGGEAQVDWYEALAEIAESGRRLISSACAAWRAAERFTCVFHATQQAFLEAHELAFAYFGGVFRCFATTT